MYLTFELLLNIHSELPDFMDLLLFLLRVSAGYSLCFASDISHWTDSNIQYYDKWSMLQKERIIAHFVITMSSLGSILYQNLWIVYKNIFVNNVLFRSAIKTLTYYSFQYQSLKFKREAIRTPTHQWSRYGQNWNYWCRNRILKIHLFSTAFCVKSNIGFAKARGLLLVL